MEVEQIGSTTREKIEVNVGLHQNILIGLTILGTVLRLYLLWDKSIWLDEAFSIAISQRAPLEILRMVVLTDAHPPLYYLLLHFWLLLGDSEAYVRLLSAFFSIASIPLMYSVATSLYSDSRVGLIAAAILTFSPFHIWFAQEVRMYAMLTFFVLASAYFLIRSLRLGGFLNWSGYILTTTLALYTDNGAIWYVAAVGVFYLISSGRFPRTLGAWIFSQAAIGLLYLGWLPFFWMQIRRVTEEFWLAPPSLQGVLDAFIDFTSFNFPRPEIVILYMIAIVLLAYILPEKPWQLGLASAWLVVPVAISFLLSLRQPIFLSRNLIVASLGLYLLIAGALWKYRSTALALTLLIPLLVMNLVSIGYNIRVEEKEDWRSVAGFVAESAHDRPGGLVVFIPGYAELPFDYYFDRYGISVDTQGFPSDETLLHPQPKVVEDIPTLLEGRPYVWLVVRDIETADPDWRVKEWLDHNGYERQEDYLRDELTVLTYVRWDLASADG